MTSRSQKGCSGAPKPGSSPYRCSRVPRAAARQGTRVLVPKDPPVLNPRASHALFRALVEAQERDGTLHRVDEGRPTDMTAGEVLRQLDGGFVPLRQGRLRFAFYGRVSTEDQQDPEASMSPRRDQGRQ